MRISRDLARIAVPPVVALGLTALLINPLAAGSTAATPLATTGGGQTWDRGGVDRDEGVADDRCGTRTGSPQSCSVAATSPAAGNASVSISAVAFTETVVASDGHLRAPVLLADPRVKARVRVVGAKTGRGCTAWLVQGTPLWIDCSIQFTRGSTPSIVVTLSDGRVARKSIMRG